MAGNPAGKPRDVRTCARMVRGWPLHREPRIVQHIVWTRTGTLRRLPKRGAPDLASLPTLEQVASDRRIVTLLVRARLREASARRESVFYERIADDERTPGRRTRLQLLLPPRRHWPRPHPKQRKRLAAQGVDARAIALSDWIMRQWGIPKHAAPDWLNRLRPFVGRIRSRLAKWTPSQPLPSPRVFAVPKEWGRAEGSPDYFRCLSCFDLETGILVSLVAKYFSIQTDHLFGDEVLAFRLPRDGSVLDHHTAVQTIREFRSRTAPSRRKPLWATEADIRGFFDCVSHDVARAAVYDLVAQVGGRFDPRALWFLEAYLGAYTFNKYGRSEALRDAHERFARSGHPVRDKWPEQAHALEELGVSIETAAVGIPQGGALSAYLANAILRSADQAVLKALPSSRSLYLRYCDDILILAPLRRDAQKALDVYIGALKRLRLPAHPPASFTSTYTPRHRLPSGAIEAGTARSFWSGKSKSPYAWNAADKRGHVPWLSFVGYQIRYDGVLRIRRDSIQKEKRKQREITDRALLEINRVGQRRTRRAIVTRLRDRLRAMAVGSGPLHRFKRTNGFCFLHGFRLVDGSAVSQTQLRELDRHRHRQLLRAFKAAKVVAARGGKKPKKAMRFLGRPFSYAGAVLRATEPA